MMTSLQHGGTYLPIDSDLRGTVTDIQNEDPVILTIESRITHRLQIVKSEIIFISEDPDIEAESIDLDMLLRRKVSIFRTSNNYRILVRKGQEKQNE